MASSRALHQLSQDGNAHTVTTNSVYEPLDSSKDQIRLLQLGPSDENGRISAHLRLVDLSDDVLFTALSYVWGDTGITEQILLNGEVKSITTNLAVALRHVSKHLKTFRPDRPVNEFWFWADAICIDQSNIPERNRQVKLMGHIYARAELVFSWLGDDSPHTDLGLETFALIAREAVSRSEDDFCSLQWMEAHPSLLSDDYEDVFPMNKRWKAMINLVDLPYWSRVWVFQEMAFASILLLGSANYVVCFEQLDLVASRLIQVRELIRQGIVLCPPFLIRHPTWILLQSEFVNFQRVKRVFFLKDWARRILNNERSPYDAEIGWAQSLFGRELHAMDPKDHVYGLMALTNLDLEVDYSEAKSVAAVYCDYAAGMIRCLSKNERRIDVPELSFLHWAGLGRFSHDFELPSWAPNFPEESKKHIAGNQPVGCADRGVFSRDLEATIVEDTNLTVAGIFVDVITKLEPVLNTHTKSDSALLRYCEDFVARNPISKTGMPPMQAILRTIQMNPTLDIDGDTIIYTFHFIRTLIEADTSNASDHLKALGFENLDSGIVDTYTNFSHPRPHGDQREQFPFNVQGDRDVCIAVSSHLVHLGGRWRFFETASGYMGLAPPKAQLGDMVYVLKGSGSPVVLRNEKDYRVHVGTCFIWNLMAGEAGALVVSREREVERVVIR